MPATGVAGFFITETRMTTTTTQTAKIIDGNALAALTRADVAVRTSALKARGLTPGLAVLLVGENQASQVYVRNKVKACADAGLHSVLERHPATMTEAELLARIDALNVDPSIHGILVQLPVPAHIDANKVIEAISPAKDVDGFHVSSAGALMVGQPGFWPCTPYGCMKMLESIGYNLRGKQHRGQTHGHDAAGAKRHRHHLPQCHRRPQGHDAAGRCHRGRRGQAQCADRRHGQTRCCGARRGHEPQR
jgi:hypothetical protein